MQLDVNSRTGVLAALIVAISAVGLTWSTDGFRAFTLAEARRLAIVSKDVVLPSTRVVDSDGRQDDLLKFIAQGEVSVVSFFYADCTTICRANGSALQRLQDAMSQVDPQDRVRLISISIDPERDDAAALTRYLQRHRADRARWHAVVPATVEQGRRLRERLGVVAIRDGKRDWKHGDATYLVAGDGRVLASFGSDEGEALTHRINALFRV